MGIPAKLNPATYFGPPLTSWRRSDKASIFYNAKYHFDTYWSQCLGHLREKVVYWLHFVPYQLPWSFSLPHTLPPPFKARPIFKFVLSIWRFPWKYATMQWPRGFISKGWRPQYCPDKLIDGMPQQKLETTQKTAKKDDIPIAKKFKYMLVSWLSLLSRPMNMAFLLTIAMVKMILAYTVHKRYLQFADYMS